MKNEVKIGIAVVVFIAQCIMWNVAFGVGQTSLLQDKQVLGEYRIVYQHSDERGATCGSERGWAYYAEYGTQHLFGTSWEPLKMCATKENDPELLQFMKEHAQRSTPRIYTVYTQKDDVTKIEALEE